MSKFNSKEYLESRKKVSAIPDVPGVYLITFENGSKLGMSKNLKSRVKTYFAPWSQKIQYIKIWRADQSTADFVFPMSKFSWRKQELALLLEQRSLARIPAQNKHGEYIYNLSREQIIAIVEEQRIQIRSEAIYKHQEQDRLKDEAQLRLKLKLLEHKLDMFKGFRHE